MIIDLLPLINNSKNFIEINEYVEVPIEYYKNTDIRKLDKVLVSGSIHEIGDDVFNLNLKVSGTMILPCALSLEDVDYSFEFSIDEEIGFDEEFEKNYKIISNTLDILPILWENIVLEIPSRVVKDNAKIKTEGDGWCLTSEEELNNNNNKLSDLKQLLEMEEEK